MERVIDALAEETRLSKASAIKFKLLLIEMLRLLKKKYSYRELSKITNVPETVLCRYVRGTMVPSLEQALSIWRKISSFLDIRKLVEEKTRITKHGYVDTAYVISDPYFLKLFGLYVYYYFHNKGVTKILTVATDGIPLATMVSSIMEAPLVIAKQHKDDPDAEYIEETVYVPLSSTATLYVRKDMLTRKDNVLVVDDFLRSGRTLRALAGIILKARARPVGAVALVSVGSRWKGILEPVYSLFHVEIE